ncbi:MAG: glycine cleavage system aminomethyltransferase GcvT [Planctomycetaceae bacterium]|nr:glycine cleavage system aminomethyltransferase GcvT [Planctomycetaceae bacterium]
MTELLRTPLYDWHVAHHGRMVEFGGWEMPVQYTGIVEEHHAVRRAAGLFDISHMGRLGFRGPQAGEFLQHLVTCRVDNLAVHQIRYGLMCREDGGVLDDVLVYRLEDSFGLVVNAGNRLKLLPWIAAQQSQFDCDVSDHTTNAVMLALQGPQVLAILQPLTTTDLASIKYYFGCTADVASVPVYLSRTGYTGEDGVELVLDAAAARALADKLLTLGVKPCGLGCRDTLRLEAAMPLYGHELTESIDPLTAGLQFAVKLDKPDFIGKAALVEIAKRTDRPVRVGLQLAGRRIAREGAAVFVGDTRLGEVTSGTFSPTLDKVIAMAYVVPNFSSIGTAVEVDIRGKREAATVVKLPFYQRKK